MDSPKAAQTPATRPVVRTVTRLPNHPRPATRGGMLMLLSALAALARRARRLRRHQLTA